MESCECVLANNHINHKLFSIYFVLSFQFFVQLLCISLVSLIFLYFAQILFENALFCRQNARLKSLIIAYRLSPSLSPGKRTLACFPPSGAHTNPEFFQTGRLTSLIDVFPQGAPKLHTPERHPKVRLGGISVRKNLRCKTRVFFGRISPHYLAKLIPFCFRSGQM